MQLNMSKGQPKFHSLQINHDLPCRPHTDVMNHGEAWIRTLGRFVGGQVWLQNPAGSVLVEVPQDISGPSAALAGRRVRGEAADARVRWTRIMHNQLHCTLPFEGDRWALIAYNRCEHEALPQTTRQKVEEVLGPLECSTTLAGSAECDEPREMPH